MRCRECDTPNPPERKICSKCGAKLPPPPSKAAAEAPRAQPRPRPAEVEDDDEEEDRSVRRRAEERDEARRPRRRPRREEEYNDDEYEDEEDIDVVEKVIPYHNRTALVAYYCGIVCLIPAVVYPFAMLLERESIDALGMLILPLPLSGIFLGILAMVFGVMGLVKARNSPKARGGGHAGFGLFVGLVTFLICVVVWILHVMEILPLGIIKTPQG